MSVAPPGGNGTIKRKGLSARAASGASVRQEMKASNERRGTEVRIGFSFRGRSERKSAFG